MAITGFRNLRKLSLEFYDYYEDKVNEVLRAIGCCLNDLQLSCRLMDVNVLIDISQMCPNLQSLSLNGSVLGHPPGYTKELEIQPFVNLKKLFLNNLYIAYPQLDVGPFHMTPRRVYKHSIIHEFALFLLSNSLNVEFIQLSSIWLTEELMLKVLDKNSLIYLKELKICKPGFCNKRAFTKLVIEQIIHKCLRSPQVILEDKGKIT